MQSPRNGTSTAADLILPDLRAALESGQLSARYQPIVRVTDRGLAALEVLARLDHPVFGTILPDQFIPQIEEAGLADRLTELIAARAFTDMTGPFLAGLEKPFTLNFPLSVLLRPEAIAVLEAQRNAAGIPADHVIIELTETTPVRDFDGLQEAVEHVRQFGYRVAIDDVSPAVAGLDRLLRIPFASLKLDKALFTDLHNDPATERFINDTIRQAHEQGMVVIAEGVETIETWTRLREIGVDRVQGFLVARPLPVAAVPIWLESWRNAPPFP